MPIYSVQGPDGRIYDIEGPEGASDAQVVSALRNHLASLPPPEEAPKPKTGIGAALSKGVESIISSGRTALGAVTGDADEAARAGLERGEAMGRKYADQVSLQKVKDAYNKDGVLSAAGEALSQIPAAIAEQAPNLAAMAGSARLGAMVGAPFGGPVGATIGGIGGALLPSLVQQFSGNVERRSSEGLPADVGLSAATALPQAGLEVAGSLIPFGGRLVQKLTGIPMGALLSRSAEGAAKLADERLLTVLAKGTGVGALAEIPTEITQLMLERAQAGLSLSSPDALKEYGETAYQVGLLAPLGAVGRLSERGGARMDVAAKQQEEAAKAAEVQQQQAAAAAQQKMTADADPAYAAKLRADYVAANVEMQRLNQAVKALSAEKDPLSVADAKDARVARDTYAKETMQPLVDEIRRVRQLHPGFDFRPPAPVAAPTVAPAAVEPAVAPVAAEPVAAEPVVTTTPMPEATVAPLTKAQAAEGTVSEPAPFTAPAAAPARMEEIQSHVEAIMGSPEIAAEMVANNEQVPGLTPEENALFLEMLQQRLAQDELTGEVAVPTGAEAAPAKKAKGKKAVVETPFGLEPPQNDAETAKLDANLKKWGDDRDAQASIIAATLASGAHIENELRTIVYTYLTQGTAAGQKAAQAAFTDPDSGFARMDLSAEDLQTFQNEVHDFVSARMAALPPVKKAKGKKAAAPAVEDTTAEPTEPKTLEQAFATTQKPKEIPVGSQYMIPGAAPLKKTGAVQTQELTQEIQTELKQLSKSYITARQEGRRADALAIIDRMRYLKEQGNAAEAGPALKGAAYTGQSETIETKPADRTSPRALQQDIARAQALPNLSDTNAELLDKLQQNLPALLRYKAPTTGQTPGLETTKAVPEAARGLGDARVRIVDFLDSLRQGLPAETEARNLQQQLAQIERQSQQEVSPRELQGMLAKAAKLPLSNKERGLLRLVGENQATIMADPAARMTVARWLASDVGQGIGEATQGLRKYFGIAPEQEAAVNPTTKALDERSARIEKEYSAARQAIDKAAADAGIPLQPLANNIQRLQEQAARAKAAVKKAEPEARGGAKPALTRLANLQGAYNTLLQRVSEASAKYDNQIKETLATSAEMKAATARLEKAKVAKNLLDTINDSDSGGARHDARNALDKLMPLNVQAETKAEASADAGVAEMQEDMFPAERKQAMQREETQGMYEDLFGEQKPTVAEIRAEKQKESRKERKLTGDLSALLGKQISFEKRRAMLAAIDEAPLKRQALEDRANDGNLSQAERDAAQVALTAYVAKLRKKAENKDKSYATAYRLRGEESAKTQELKKQAEAPGLTDSERAPKQALFRKAQDQLNKRDEQLARLRGVAIEAIETPEQRSKTLDTLFRETYGQAVTEEEQEQLDKTKGRALGPVSRKEVQPAKVLYTGDASQIGLPETEKRTYTKPDMRLKEQRGVKQRNVQISKEEMETANKLRQEKKAAFDERAQERQLFDTAQKKVEELNTKLSNIKERVAAYSKLEKKKAGVQERLADEQNSVATELAGAKADAARLAPKTGTVSQQTEGTLEGEFEGRARENSPDYELRDTVDLTGAALEAVQDGRVLDALDAVGANSNSPFVKELVKNLRPLVMRTKLRVEDNVTVRGKRAEGVYDFETNTVTIDSQALTEEALLHEVTHAVTARLLTVDPSKLTTEQRAARAELEKLFKSIQNDKAFENEYGKKDIHEFASEVMSNKVLRDKLAARTWHGANLLQKIYRALLNFIGFKTENMADASVGSIYKLFTPSTTAAKAGIAMSPAGIAYPKLVSYANPGLAAAGEIGDTFVAKQRGAIDRVRAAAGGFLGLETQLVDRFAPLERASKGMEALKGSQMMYYLRMYDQRMNYTAQSVANGAIQRVAKQRKDGRTEYVVESVDGANIQQVVDILKKAPAGSPDAANRLFTMYLAGIRAKNKGFQTLHFGDKLTEAQLDSAMASIRATPGLEENFKQARDVYNEYNRNMVGFLAQSGAISKEHAARLTKENDYIPFYREQNGVASLTIGGETPIRIGSIAEQPYLHELVGGDRPILDFLTSSVQNTALITDMGLRNLATKNSMNELQDIGLAQIRWGPGTADPKVVRFKMDGDDYHAVVDTDSAGIPADLLVKGMQGIPTQLPAIVRALGMPATLIRRAVTLSPTYAARQLFRDSLAAPLLSGADFVPVLGALTEIGKSATKSTLEKRGITGGQIFAGGSSSEAITKVINDMLSGKGNLGSLIAKAEALNMAADAATRRAQYNSYIKQGLSEMEATLMSLESMNFNKRGASPSIHMANALIPFFNSQIQGLNVLYKALTGKLPFDKRLKIQEKLITRGMLMFGASLAYAAMMQDDEAYKNATPEQKYGNWFIRIAGIDEPIKFPIPFEVGYFFKALPEAIYNSMANESGSEEAFKALNAIILQTLPGGTSMATVQYKGVNIPITPPIPQALKPGIEAALGKSFYTGRDILSRREQAVLPEQQFREGTSEIAKMMGSGLGLSPIKIEALVSGYTGTMGLALMQTLSMGVPTGESPEKTVKRLSDMPVVGNSFQPNDAGGIINAVYDRMDDVKKVKTTVDRMLAEGRVAEAKELISKRSDEFAQAGVADYFISNMQQITKFENAIRASNLSGEEKRTKLDETRQMKIRLAETVRQATDAAKKVD